MHRVPTVPIEVNKTLDPLEVEFQALGSFGVGAGNQTWVPEGAASALDG